VSSSTSRIGRPLAIGVFAVFAFSYFFGALVRAVPATLAPTLVEDLGIGPGELGLLAGAFAIGFGLSQLPLGNWLDRFGPRAVLSGCLAIAVVSCLGFAAATDFVGLTLARALMGVGVGACLMAPLTAFRRWFDLQAQLRANSWILVASSFGMLGSTLPVQLALPLIGWRGVFVVVAAMFAIALASVLIWVPRESAHDRPAPDSPPATGVYRSIWRQRTFRTYAGIAFANYGGMIAMQTLWIGPWLVNVTGESPRGAAAGLLLVNACMLAAFVFWGLLMPRLMRAGWSTARLIVWITPLSLLVLAVNILLGSMASAASWALFCVSCSSMSLALPLVGRSFGPALAGRALAAFNLVLFAGVFSVQWGYGLALELFLGLGLPTVDAYRAALGLYGLLALLTYLHHAFRYCRGHCSGA
jgi:predicted MFS family arabinose efflux permease